MMVDLISILEGIRIQFAEPEIMKYEENYLFEDGGDKQYLVWAEFEVVGAFQRGNRIKVLVHIRRFSCHEDIFEVAIKDFEKHVKKEVTERVPEAEGYIDILFARAEDLKKISEYAFEI